jgi:hypothetical protein
LKTLTKLNQIIAVEKGIKATAARELADIQHRTQVSALLSGISRTYQPRDEDGEQLPPESTRVQTRVEDALHETAATLTRLFDVTATKDWSNCTAHADITVDGTILVHKVPVTYLLFLEKQLNELHAFLRALPVLDAAENWTWDDSADTWRTDATRTVRTKKLPRNHVVAEATDKHPAQVQVYTEDIPAGYWTTMKFSGAMPARRVNLLMERIKRLQEAVKFAREEANNIEVTDEKVGNSVFGWLLAPEAV